MFRQSSIAIVFVAATLSFGSTAHAQDDGAKRSQWQRFDEVTVNRIQPEDLPQPEESTIPRALRSDSALPRPVNLETLRASTGIVSRRLVEVIAVDMGRSSLRRTPVVMRGHAVWISSRDDGAQPLLITNLHWLQQADEIFVRPAKPVEGGELPRAEKRSLKSLHADAGIDLDDPSLIKAALDGADKHRNLVILRPEGDKVTPPTRGLTFFPFEGQSATRVYGFSHLFSSTLVETQFFQTPDDETELIFYLQSTFPATLGAPIVTSDGRIIGMVAMRHPREADRSLVIPPGALRAFVEKHQPDANSKNDDEDDKAEAVTDRDG